MPNTKTIWHTKEECNRLALEYNPRIAENLSTDPDYCIRGKVFDPKTNLYAEFDDALLHANILLKDAVDIKDFRRLMEKHEIEVTDEKMHEKQYMFTVLTTPKNIEEIMIETRMEWDFYERN